MTFIGCKALESITLPNSVALIGTEAFKDCRALKTICLPTSLTKIHDDVFECCESLESIVSDNSDVILMIEENRKRLKIYSDVNIYVDCSYVLK